MRAARFAIPPFPPAARIALAATIGGAGAIGCQRGDRPAGSSAEAASRPVAREMELTWDEQPLGGVAGGLPPTTVTREGVPPLLYLSEVEQTIRVIDRSGEQIVAETTVRPRTIVRVDQRTGIAAGAEELLVGPLPAGRRYAIVIVPDGANVSRTGSLKPTRRNPDPDAGAAGEE